MWKWGWIKDHDLITKAADPIVILETFGSGGLTSESLWLLTTGKGKGLGKNSVNHWTNTFHYNILSKHFWLQHSHHIKFSELSNSKKTWLHLYTEVHANIFKREINFGNRFTVFVNPFPNWGWGLRLQERRQKQRYNKFSHWFVCLSQELYILPRAWLTSWQNLGLKFGGAQNII